MKAEIIQAQQELQAHFQSCRFCTHGARCAAYRQMSDALLVQRVAFAKSDPAAYAEAFEVSHHKVSPAAKVTHNAERLTKQLA